MERTGKIPISGEEETFGVYLLYDEEEVVYVGKSISPKSRVQYHIENTEKYFTHYEIINCNSEQEMNQLEGELIFKYTPIYNKTLPTKYHPNLEYVGQVDNKDNKKVKLYGVIIGGRLYVHTKKSKIAL